MSYVNYLQRPVTLTTNDLLKIEKLLDRKFDEKLDPIKINQRFMLERLEKVENKLDVRFAEYDKEIKVIKQRLNLND